MTETLTLDPKTTDLAEVIREIEKNRIDPNSFRGMPFFTDQEIDADLARCADQQAKFEATNTAVGANEEIEKMLLVGKTAEYVFRSGMEDHWLDTGGNVHMIMTSQYDDYFRGIDSIGQIVTGEGQFDHIGFSVDFTVSAEDVGKKIAKTFDSLDNGYVPSVKYFESEKTGKLKNFKVPRLVIGAGSLNIQRLANYYDEIVHHSGQEQKANEELANDPFKFVLFGEIMAQLQVFCNRLEKVIAQAKSQRNADVEKRAAEALRIHRKAFSTIVGLTQKQNVPMNEIQKHIRGDALAMKLGTSLALLNQTPIVFK